MQSIYSNKLIMFQDIGNVVKVYNGSKWVVVRITEGMLFHYVGEFIITKKQGGGIHKMKNKKKSKGKKGI